jgi:DDE superfamily endonuclease
MGQVARCFPRQETRQCCGQMVSGLLMELEDHNCWTIAEAAGHRGPHRLQHLLSRAVWDEQQVLDNASAWAAGHLDDVGAGHDQGDDRRGNATRRFWPGWPGLGPVAERFPGDDIEPDHRGGRADRPTGWTAAWRAGRRPTSAPAHTAEL